MSKFWTPTEIEFLTENYPLMGIKPCADKLGRTDSSVAKKALRLGLKAPSAKKSTDKYKEEISRLDLELLEPYDGAFVAILHKCSKGHEFRARPSNILSSVKGCFICANRYTRTTEEYLTQIAFKVLEEYIDTRTPILHECEIGHIWRASPSNVLKGSGCPSCAHYGFNPDKPARLYYIKFSKDSETYYKVGITNRSIRERFNKDKDLEIIVLYEHVFTSGYEARELEKSILEEYKPLRINNTTEILNSGGNTELFKIDVLGFDN